jgi:hypothetical protein
VCAQTAQELQKLVAAHDETKEGLVAPIKALMKKNPEMEEALIFFIGLLNSASSDGELRNAIVEAANALISQEKLIGGIKHNMMKIEVGNKEVERRKRQENYDRKGVASTLMSARALLEGASSSGQSPAKLAKRARKQ